MKEKITVYQKPTCSTCRNLDKLLKEGALDYEKINYYVKPFSAAKLTSLLKKMGIPARQLLRSKEALYKELGLAKADLSEGELIDLMVKHPDLVQRPIVEKGDRAILARPIENVESFLKGT